MTEHQQQKPLNTHLVLSIVSLCLTPLLGFFALPAAIAALIFSLKAENDLTEKNIEAAKAAARYAGIFGWVAIAFVDSGAYNNIFNLWRGADDIVSTMLKE